MARRRVEVTVFPEYRGHVSPAWVRQAVGRALEAAGFRRAAEMGVVLADDETVRRLNGQYRGLDEVTDVLAFSFWDGGSPSRGERTFVSPPDLPEPLGEVIIAYPQVVRQAGEQGHAVERELALMVVHGVLHLLGHDHEEPEEERAMKALETRALSQLFPSS